MTTKTLWEGTLIDNLGNDARLKVVRTKDTIDVLEWDSEEAGHPEGIGWHDCQDDDLTIDALKEALARA